MDNLTTNTKAKEASITEIIKFRYGDALTTFRQTYTPEEQAPD